MTAVLLAGVALLAVPVAAGLGYQLGCRAGHREAVDAWIKVRTGGDVAAAHDVDTAMDESISEHNELRKEGDQ